MECPVCNSLLVEGKCPKCGQLPLPKEKRLVKAPLVD